MYFSLAAFLVFISDACFCLLSRLRWFCLLIHQYFSLLQELPETPIIAYPTLIARKMQVTERFLHDAWDGHQSLEASNLKRGDRLPCTSHLTTQLKSRLRRANFYNLRRGRRERLKSWKSVAARMASWIGGVELVASSKAAIGASTRERVILPRTNGTGQNCKIRALLNLSGFRIKNAYTKKYLLVVCKSFGQRRGSPCCYTPFWRMA